MEERPPSSAPAATGTSRAERGISPQSLVYGFVSCEGRAVTRRHQEQRRVEPMMRVRVRLPGAMATGADRVMGIKEKATTRCGFYQPHQPPHSRCHPGRPGKNFHVHVINKSAASGTMPSSERGLMLYYNKTGCFQLGYRRPGRSQELQGSSTSHRLDHCACIKHQAAVEDGGWPNYNKIHLFFRRKSISVW
jgi:hypothetical protein